MGKFKLIIFPDKMGKFTKATVSTQYRTRGRDKNCFIYELFAFRIDWQNFLLLFVASSREFRSSFLRLIAGLSFYR